MGDRGRPKLDFLETNGLDFYSCPEEYFAAFVPDSLVGTWTTYTNNKAILSNAGQEGQPYPDFSPFKIAELKQHIGVRIFHGLEPSPRVEMKFLSQANDPVNGNDFFNRSLVPNAKRRHKMFRRFFAVQDPAIKCTKSRRDCQNWKVETFLLHILSVILAAW